MLRSSSLGRSEISPNCTREGVDSLSMRPSLNEVPVLSDSSSRRAHNHYHKRQSDNGAPNASPSMSGSGSSGMRPAAPSAVNNATAPILRLSQLPPPHREDPRRVSLSSRLPPSVHVPSSYNKNASFPASTAASTQANPAVSSPSLSRPLRASPERGPTITGRPAAARPRQSTVIKDGMLQKWTNYMGTWKERYFIVEPGIIKYAQYRGGPIKETIPLSQNICRIRLCPGDPLRLEIETSFGVLYLRMSSAKEKKQWVDAIQTAKTVFEEQRFASRKLRSGSINQSPPPKHREGECHNSIRQAVERKPLGEQEGGFPNGPAYPSFGDDDSDSGEERSPMACLMESCAAFRQSLQSIDEDIQSAQAQMLQIAGNVKEGKFKEDFRGLAVRIVRHLETLQQRISRHLTQSESLAMEERTQRRTLERSLRALAKRNYRMQKTVLKLRSVVFARPRADWPRTGSSAEAAMSRRNSECLYTQTPSNGANKGPSSDRTALVESNISSGSGAAGNQKAESNSASPGDISGRLASFFEGPAFKSDSRKIETDVFKRGDEDSSGTSYEVDDDDDDDDISDEVFNEAVEFFDVDDPGDESRELKTSNHNASLPDPDQLTAETIPRTATNLIDHEDDNRAAGSGSLSRLHLAATGQSTSSLAVKASIKRRSELPKPRTEFKVSLWSILKDCIGKDLSRIAMPVYFNEPTSLLQRLAEDFQYAKLLNKAAKQPEAVDRTLWVALFSATPYASTVGRTYKPFNPLLGETFELVHRGYRFLAEQVGHHPPMTAYQADSEAFNAWGHLVVKNRFTGKSLEVTLPGNVHVELKLRHNLPGAQTIQTSHFEVDEHGEFEREHFSMGRTKMLVNNVIFGKLTVEMFGQNIITNHTTGGCAFIEYLRQGWWSREAHVVRGLVYDVNGVPRYRLGGWWSRELWIEDLDIPLNSPLILGPTRPREVIATTEGHVSDGRGLGNEGRDRSSSTSKRTSRKQIIMDEISNTMDSSKGPPPASAAIEANPTTPVASGVQQKMIASDDVESHHQTLSYLIGRQPIRYTARQLQEFNRIDWDDIAAKPGTRRVVWRPEPRPPSAPKYYEFGQMTMELNEITPEYDITKGAIMPCTDSRYRPDQRLLEQGLPEYANEAKTRLEDKQRAAARLRASSEVEYKPLWFEQEPDCVSDERAWVPNGNYWKAKKSDPSVFATCCPQIF